MRDCLLVFAKPARPGRVKTRLVPDLSAEQAAELYAAFLADALERLRSGAYDLEIAWAVEPGEPLPAGPVPGRRQAEGDLGERMLRALSAAAATHPRVAVVGSDHPGLAAATVEDAFARLASGADIVLGPAEDGGYYLFAATAAALAPDLFAGIPWSSDRVLAETLERCARAGREVSLLPREADVDTPDDLRRLARRLAVDAASAPRTRALLGAWGRLPA